MSLVAAAGVVMLDVLGQDDNPADIYRRRAFLSGTLNARGEHGNTGVEKSPQLFHGDSHPTHLSRAPQYGRGVLVCQH